MATPLQSRKTNVVRITVWVLLSIVLLYVNLHGIALSRARGLHPSTFAWVLVVIWLIVLLFWLGMAWREWTNRER